MPPAVLAVTAEGASCAARAVPSDSVFCMLAARPRLAGRLPDGVSGAGREPSAVVGANASSAVRPSRATKSAAIITGHMPPGQVYESHLQDFHLNGDSPRPTRGSPLPLAARRFPLAAAQFPLGTQLLRLGTRLRDSGGFQKATRVYTRATRATGGDSRNRLGARGGNSPERLGHQGGASRRGGRRLAAASRPGRGRLAAARCPVPLPCAAPRATSSAVPSYTRYVRRVQNVRAVVAQAGGGWRTCVNAMPLAAAARNPDQPSSG